MLGSISSIVDNTVIVDLKINLTQINNTKVKKRKRKHYNTNIC